jgi:hypothetical protein
MAKVCRRRLFDKRIANCNREFGSKWTWNSFAIQFRNCLYSLGSIFPFNMGFWQRSDLILSSTAADL